MHASTRLLLCLTAPNIAKQGMRRIDNSMHRKSRRLLKNIVILSIENPQSHTDNSRKCGAQKIADTLRTRMLGKSLVCQNSVVGKKAKCWEAANSASSGAKSKFPGKKKSFQPMLFARLARRTREHQPERIACLGIESSGSRTHDLLLRRAKKRSPLSASECLQMPKYQRFPPFSDVRISSKNRLFYPVRVSRVLAASNFGGRPFSHDVRFC